MAELEFKLQALRQNTVEIQCLIWLKETDKKKQDTNWNQQTKLNTIVQARKNRAAALQNQKLYILLSR